MALEQTLAQLKGDESVRLKPYLDCCGKYWRLCTCANKGKLTIGVGRNLDDDGISLAESDQMEWNDVNLVYHQLRVELPWVSQLSDARFGVLANMCFNLGWPTLSCFVKMLAYLKAGDYESTALEMAKSKWAKQVGPRATRLIQQMRTDQWVYLQGK